MLIQIAWRNIWRSKLRSMIVIGAVLLGVWALVFLLAFSNAMVNGYVKNAIRYQTSHIQVHQPEFLEDKEVKYALDNPESLYAKLNNDPEIAALSMRTIVNGMIRSPRAARGILIRGVVPDEELVLTQLNEKLIEGAFLNAEKKNQILISEELATKLKLKLRKKVELQFQTMNGDVTAGSFRVVGIFKTGNTVLDLSQVIVRKQDINRLLESSNAAHEVAMLVKDTENLQAIKDRLSATYPDLLFEDYREISPDVKLYEQQLGVSLAIFGTIFMLAIIFGIINTMLMAVLERNREIGMLMAVGMNKVKVFMMIVIETLLLGIIGAPIGLFLGWLTVNYFGSKGIDLGSFAQGIERFGLETMIYTELDTGIYITLMMAVLFTSLLAAIYPSFKAVCLRPVEAIRKI